MEIKKRLRVNGNPEINAVLLNDDVALLRKGYICEYYFT